jgi:hypothetical protein
MLVQNKKYDILGIGDGDCHTAGHILDVYNID